MSQNIAGLTQRSLNVTTCISQELMYSIRTVGRSVENYLNDKHTTTTKTKATYL